ncbi:NfeD family protein [Candidatus Stoquefichus massiliensis]|uniref:NfeD family protein n=1 Tax=Candidatus Stoquefichus massiliensis TaxID=1470350 RepID=UPI0004876E4B|nr:NfeD family protein [Candidatus Stoquefichus massiliensis]
MSITFIWTLVLVISVIVEAITVDLVSIWFGLGAIAALIGEWLGLSQAMQMVLFAVISVICIIVSRPLAKKYLRGNTIKTNLDRIIGKHCLVTETITADNKGEVKVMGNLWAATSLNNEKIQAGEYAEVISIEGSHVVVKKINMGDENIC